MVERIPFAHELIVRTGERSAVREQQELGREPGQPTLLAGGPAPALGSGRDVLPAFEQVAEKPRPMWRHPAFIVSAILTILALLAAAAFAVLSIFGPGAGEVKSAAIEVVDGNAHLTWEASGDVELYVVTNGQPLDLTQLIAGKNEAWIPAALNLYTQSSCFVVRPATDEPEDVSLDGSALTSQGASSVCVA